jgi:hypothetical protein
MLDQVEAIRFIKDEIINFGGDPFRITVGGVSGGAASVSAHTYSPLSRDLFQLAIEESGSVYTNMQGALGTSYISFQAAQKFCGWTVSQWNTLNYTDLKTCMMGISAVNLSNIDSGAQGWKIVQDNYFLPDVPRNLWQSRPNIPRIIGTVKDEWAYYEIDYMNNGITHFTDYSRQYFEAEFGSPMAGQPIFGAQLPTALSIFERMFVPPGTADDDHFAWLKATVHAFTAAGFSGGISKDIEWYLRNNNTNVYVYDFTWPGNITNHCRVADCNIPGWNPVIHAAEVKYVFMEDGVWENGQNNNLLTPMDFTIADFIGET